MCRAMESLYILTGQNPIHAEQVVMNCPRISFSCAVLRPSYPHPSSSSLLHIPRFVLAAKSLCQQHHHGANINGGTLME